MDERDLDLYEHTDTVNELLARYGVKFGIYKNNTYSQDQIETYVPSNTDNLRDPQ